MRPSGSPLLTPGGCVTSGRGRPLPAQHAFARPRRLVCNRRRMQGRIYSRERPDPGSGAEEARCEWRYWSPRPVTLGAGIPAADQRAPSHRCNPGSATLSAPPKMTKTRHPLHRCARKPTLSRSGYTHGHDVLDLGEEFCRLARVSYARARPRHTSGAARGTPTRRLMRDWVGMTRVSSKPAAVYSAPYSASVRSCPPGPTSMLRSLSLP
jgi:hypothetical protein